MAIERPHVGRMPAQDVVFIPTETSRAGMGETIHNALGEIQQILEQQKVAASGPWFAHHHRRPTETFLFDVCFPVKHPVELSGRLQAAHLPEIEVVRTAYHGGYEGLPSAWSEFVEWIEARGYSTREDFFELYSIGPGDAKEADRWQTDLLFPLAAGEAGKERLV